MKPVIIIPIVFVLFIVPIDAYADITIVTAAGSGSPGCEETPEGCYIPYNAIVHVDGVIIFSNTDSAAHTFTSGTPSDGPDGLFDSSLMVTGSTFEWNPTEVGEVPYYCMVHPWMIGKIIISSTYTSSTSSPPQAISSKIVSNEIGSIELEQSIFNIKRGDNSFIKIFGKITNPMEGGKIGIVVTDPDFNSNGQHVFATEQGIYEIFYPLDYNSPEGTYKILVSYSSSIIGQITFEVIHSTESSSTKEKNPSDSNNNQNDILIEYTPEKIKEIQKKLADEEKEILQDRLFSAISYISNQEKLDSKKSPYYYAYRVSNEAIFEDWWDKRFPSIDVLEVLSKMTGRTINWELDCKKDNKIYLTKNVEHPVCENPHSYYQRELNFPNPELTKQDYYKKYENPIWKKWFDKYPGKYFSLDDYIQYLDEKPIPKPITRTIGYDIDNICELAYFWQYHMHFKSFNGRNYDFSQYHHDSESEQKKLQEILYGKYEEWEIAAGYVDQEEVKRELTSYLKKVRSEQTDYVMKHHDINPKLWRTVDKSVHIMSSSSYDQDKYELGTIASMVNPNLYGENNICEKKFHEYFGENTYQGLKNIHRNDMGTVDKVWTEIKSRVYDD